MSISIKKRIEDIFKKSDINLSAEKIDLFCRFYDLFNKYNDESDLSRIKNTEDIIIKHFVDSIYVTKFCKLPSSLVDIGTGAGFPGLPLKIVSPETYIYLAEPRHKRVDFMNLVIKELGLEKVEVYPHKVTEHSFLNTTGVITRAFEQVNGTLERVKHFIPQGGQIIFMKGPKVDEDFERVSDENKNDYKLLSDIPYILPGINHDRRLVIYEKTSSKRNFIYKIGVDNHIPGIVISSGENKKFKEFKKLTSSQGIKKEKKSIISGKKQIKEIVTSYPELCKNLLLFDGYNEKDEDFQKIIDSFNEKNSLYLFKKSLYNEIDYFKSNSPLLIADIPEIKEWDDELTTGCSLVVPFQDPVNVGTIIRTAIAFNVERIILTKEAANPFNQKSIRTSGGAVFSAPLFRGSSLDEITELCNEKNYPLITMDSRGKDISNFQFPESYMLLPGIEGPGLPDNLLKDAISIPISDKIESLNASIATSIALFMAKK